MSNWWENKEATTSWDEAKPAAEETTTWAASSWDEKKEEPAQDNAWVDAKQSSWDEAPQAPPPATEFWDTQKWNLESSALPRKEEWELERDDSELFNLQGRAQAHAEGFSRYDSVAVDISGNKADLIPVFKTFEEIYAKFRQLLPEALMENLKKVQYTTPTPVQRFAVPCGLVGRDIMCCAQTGSGKTAAFLLPSIGRMMKHHSSPMGMLETPFAGACQPDTLVMTPTRELCIQIFEEAQKFCHRTPYRVGRVYGGERAKLQMPTIAQGADLLVATPGRLKDFMDRGIIVVSSVHVLVLDEADRMLDMGFESDIREIVGQGMPPKENRQTMMFSATFPESIQTMAQDYLYDHIWIGVGQMNSAVETVRQEMKKVTPANKFEELMAILDDFYATRHNQERLLIFVNAKDTAKWLDEQLYEKSMNSGALHGNLEQEERETNLKRFRKGEIDVMIATDVAARGLDIESVGIVVNYDCPRDADTYIHRIGRTGRIGNTGRAITFLSCDDESSKTLEDVQLLKELVTVMQNSKALLPDWMETLIETSEAGASWSWGNKDARDTQESTKWTGAGDSWWEKDASAAAEGAPGLEKKADDSWQKKEDDGWKEDSWGQQQQQEEAPAAEQPAAADYQ